MNKKKAVVALIALLTWALAGQALAQGQELELKSNADDLAKIRGVLEEFRQDIIHKDGYALTKLMLNPKVLLHEIDDQKEVDRARKYNAQFDGIGPSDLGGTAKFFSTSKDKLEQKFYNIEIRQDGPLGPLPINFAGRSSPLPGRAMIAADSQQRSREQGELMRGDCAGPLKKEKRMVISAPSARGKGNCVPLICRLFRPSSELVFGPSRKFSQKIDRNEPVETGSLRFHH